MKMDVVGDESNDGKEKKGKNGISMKKQMKKMNGMKMKIILKNITQIIT